MSELIAGQNLEELLQIDGPLREAVVANFAKQLLNLIKYLHGMNIFFATVNPVNILISNAEHNGILKLAQYGTSLLKRSVGEDDDAAPLFTAPETLEGVYGKFSDI